MKYEKLGFITAQEIVDLANELAPDAVEGLVKSINEGNTIVSFPYTEQSVENTEGSFTPEFVLNRPRKTFTRVDGDIYTDSMVFFHIVRAHSQGLSIQGYLEDLLSKAAESERVAKKQQEKLGDIEERRVDNE